MTAAIRVVAAALFDGERRVLFDLDQSVQRLTTQLGGDDRSVVELTGVYHNLLRRWADA